jgi:peptidoglycan hydrolase-like protein with peptidoglycan-binding domain
MPNPGQPTIQLGASGNVVRRLQRALRRTPNLGLPIDGVFGSGLRRLCGIFRRAPVSWLTALSAP